MASTKCHRTVTQSHEGAETGDTIPSVHVHVKSSRSVPVSGVLVHAQELTVSFGFSTPRIRRGAEFQYGFTINHFNRIQAPGAAHR